MSIRTIVAGALLVASAAPAAAQPAAPVPLPTKAEKTDYRYFTIETITTKPGARMWDFMATHILPAIRAAGLPVPAVYHGETGPLSTVIVTELTGGTADLNWSTSPDRLKFLTALAKQEGSPEKAMAIVRQYEDKIATRTRELVHMHVGQ